MREQQPRWGLAFRTNDSANLVFQDHLLAMSADNETERAIHGPEQPGGASGGGGSGRTDMPPSYPPANPPSYQQVNKIKMALIICHRPSHIHCNRNIIEWNILCKMEAAIVK